MKRKQELWTHDANEETLHGVVSNALFKVLEKEQEHLIKEKNSGPSAEATLHFCWKKKKKIVLPRNFNVGFTTQVQIPDFFAHIWCWWDVC